MDVVLVARRRDRLEALAKELSEQHGIATHVVSADLADPGAPAALQSELASAGVHVDVLVNNAGYGLKKGFVEASWQEHADFVQVMGTSVAETCHRFAPAMVERGWGRIINVSSLAAFAPQVPGNLYGAVKSFVVALSEALDLELAPHGVNVSALCPGYTLSEFHDVIDVRDQIDAMPGFMVMDAETVVREGWEAVERGRSVWINGWVNRAIAAVLRLMPASLLRFVARRSVLRPKR